MSIPPQLIRVKRKRDDETPVAFLQFDEGFKRHRSGSNWVYQRRDPAAKTQTPAASRASRDVTPVIHVSEPKDETPSNNTHDGRPASRQAAAIRSAQRSRSRSPASRLSTGGNVAEQRRFHMSRKLLSPSDGQPLNATGISKRSRYGPAVFIERSRAAMTQKAVRASVASQPKGPESQHPKTTDEETDAPKAEKRLKKPGVAKKIRTPQEEELSDRSPLPPSIVNRQHDDMGKIADDMNAWVMKEIGANLRTMEQERQAEKVRFRPKAPEKRYHERHPEPEGANHKDNDGDTPMPPISDKDDDGDDWVIDEYVRIPVGWMTRTVTPSDIGVLVVENEEDFFGLENDDDDDFAEDDEDENAENHYTADYPEDEVDSEDEPGRQAYLYRNGNASDDEEFDNDYYDDSDEIVMEGDGDEDTTLARTRAYMKRNSAFP